MQEQQTGEDDRELFDLWFKGDPRGFSGLYDKYKNRVFGFLVRMTNDREVAEDLLQETFLAALRNADQFDRTRNLLSWLFGIAHKRTIDYFRHAKVETDHKQDAEGAIGSRIEAPDQKLSDENLKKIINAAVEELDPQQKEVFLLRELGGVPFKEIAEIMNCPINTALGRMRLALKNIRKELKKGGSMACNKWEEAGLLYCSSELSEQDTKSYEEHLGQCVECKGEFDIYMSEKSSFFTTNILSETPSEKVDTELKRLFAVKKQYTSTGIFSGFVKKTVYSLSFFLLGLAVVGYFVFNIQTAKNQETAQKVPPVSEVKTLAQKDSASALKDSLKDSAVYFSKNRGNLETNGVYPVDLK